MDGWYPAQDGPERSAREQPSATSTTASIPRTGDDGRLLQRRLRPGAPARRRRSQAGSAIGTRGGVGVRGSRRSRRRSRRGLLGPVGRRVQGRDRRPGRASGGRERVRRPRRARDGRPGPLGARLPRRPRLAALRRHDRRQRRLGRLPVGRAGQTCASTRSSPTSRCSRRFEIGLDASALALIRREWGYMLANGPRSTMWETIGPYGEPAGRLDPVLRPRLVERRRACADELRRSASPRRCPASARSARSPHPSDLSWARGTVPTPHGADPSSAGACTAGKLTAKVVSPCAGTVVPARGGPTSLDGKPIARQTGLNDREGRRRHAHARRRRLPR